MRELVAFADVVQNRVGAEPRGYPEMEIELQE